MCGIASASVSHPDSGVANWLHVGVVAPEGSIVFSQGLSRLNTGMGLCAYEYVCVCFINVGVLV